MPKNTHTKSNRTTPTPAETVNKDALQELSPTQWLDMTVVKGFEARASDIHIEPYQGELIVRYRVDGVLRITDRQPLAIHEIIMSRLKVLAQLNIAENRKPQEGHATVIDPDNAERTLDVRVSIFPTILGETADLRVLNRKEIVFEHIDGLGMSMQDAERFADVITRPNGMILVSGPVGVGKTTTLYTALKQLQAPERNIMTLEDPVEYRLDFVRQSQINPAYGYTFSTGLKSILRQDPDVIMVGEIRDSETAEIAIRASLLGRLLFSTLHTNDSVSSIVRLLEFGIPRSFIASALHMVISQRLVRKICQNCIEEYKPSFRALSAAGFLSEEATAKFKRGKGCEKCFKSGFYGREGVFEALYFDDEIKAMVLEDASVSDIRNSARVKGMVNLREEAIKKAVAGVTTLEEAVHATPG